MPSHFFVTGRFVVTYMKGSNVIETWIRSKIELATTERSREIGSDLVTIWAHDGTPVLSLEQVDDDRIVPTPVLFPAGLCHLDQLLVPSSFPVWCRSSRFLEDPVQIFVGTVEEECEEFLRVLLTITRKLRCKPSDGLFELARGN